MDLEVLRYKSGKKATLGELYVDGKFECYTLEDIVREKVGFHPRTWKIFGKTAIPAGVYRVIISMSNRFKRPLCEILGVPGFTGIRIHSGNTDENTEGCLLLGSAINRKNEVIVGGTSRAATNALQAKVQTALNRGEKVFITFKNK